MAESGRVTLVEKRRRLIACMRGREPYDVAFWLPVAGAKWQHPTLRGHMVAFEWRSARSQSHRLSVVDLARRRQCYAGTVGTGRTAGGDPGDTGEPLRDLAMRRSGALAYIAGPGVGPRAETGEHPDLPPWTGYEVMVVDGDGTRQVAAGPDIELGSLAIDGRQVTWRQGGVTRSAALGRRPGCNTTPPV